MTVNQVTLTCLPFWTYDNIESNQQDSNHTSLEDIWQPSPHPEPLELELWPPPYFWKVETTLKLNTIQKGEFKKTQTNCKHVVLIAGFGLF